jgi:predicted nucleotidyltransferase
VDDADLRAHVLRVLPEAQAVYLFGSFGGPYEHPASDIDLAVLMSEPLEPVRRWELQEQLASVLGRDVDLVDLRDASTVLRMQVVDGGRVLFDGVPSERELFEAHTLSDYADLQWRRRGILEDIAARGTVT